MTPQPLEIFTDRFSGFRPESGIPVRTTVGAPRFKLKYELAASRPELGPDRSWMNSPRAEFTTLYRAKLDLLGVDGVLQLLAPIAEEHQDHRIVLLCFDDLRRDGVWCHRTLFAEWFSGAAGVPVVELQHLENRPAGCAKSSFVDTPSAELLRPEK